MPAASIPITPLSPSALTSRTSLRVSVCITFFHVAVVECTLFLRFGMSFLSSLPGTHGTLRFCLGSFLVLQFTQAGGASPSGSQQHFALVQYYSPQHTIHFSLQHFLFPSLYIQQHPYSDLAQSTICYPVILVKCIFEDKRKCISMQKTTFTPSLQMHFKGINAILKLFDLGYIISPLYFRGLFLCLCLTNILFSSFPSAFTFTNGKKIRITVVAQQ